MDGFAVFHGCSKANLRRVIERRVHSLETSARLNVPNCTCERANHSVSVRSAAAGRGGACGSRHRTLLPALHAAPRHKGPGVSEKHARRARRLRGSRAVEGEQPPAARRPSARPLGTGEISARLQQFTPHSELLRYSIAHRNELCCTASTHYNSVMVHLEVRRVCKA
jgi:hypothetical protein